MYMMAKRLKDNGKPMLKLYIHEVGEEDKEFLDSLGIDKFEEDTPTTRYTIIHSQDEFLATRAAILERYDAEEKGPRVFLEKK